MGIAKRHNLCVLEDSAESLGSVYNGRKAKIVGHANCFSFNGNKLITTGSGGAIISEDNKRLTHIRYLVNQARDNNGRHYYSEMGFNYRMTNIAAALGLAQLKKIDKFLERKKGFRQIYQDLLGDLEYVKFQNEQDNTEGSSWLTGITIERDIDIDDIIRRLEKKHIQTRHIFLPVSEMLYLKRFSRKCPNAYAIYKKGLCLPSSILNTRDDIRRAALEIKKILKESVYGR
jgi:perosamine synthetase